MYTITVVAMLLHHGCLVSFIFKMMITQSTIDCHIVHHHMNMIGLNNESLFQNNIYYSVNKLVNLL